MTRSIALTLAVFLFLGDAASAKDSDSGSRQSKETFRWTGRSPTLFLRNLNGRIDVTGVAAGDEIEVVGTVSWRSSDPSLVRVETYANAGGVTICALFPTRSKKATCGADGAYQSSDTQNQDLDVRFDVKLPRGTRLDVSTTNGALSVQGLAADGTIRTVNGGVDIAHDGGALTIEAVNGAVTVKSTAAKGDLGIATVNGAITIDVPDEAGAAVEAQTMNGAIRIGGEKLSRVARRSFGKGSRRITAETMNGAITVR
jgi:hypothetical protein